jgi:hypothetical protein
MRISEFLRLSGALERFKSIRFVGKSMSEYSNMIKKLAVLAIEDVSKEFRAKASNISNHPGLRGINELPEYHKAIDAIKKYSDAVSKKIDDMGKR